MIAREALRHPYFTSRPLPKSPEMMPTFPTRWEDATNGGDAGYR